MALRRTEPSVGQQLAQIVVVVALIGAGGDEIEAARRPFIDRELGAHAAARREQMAERDAAHLLRDAVGEDRVEPVARARSRHLHLGEGRHVLQRRHCSSRCGIPRRRRGNSWSGGTTTSRRCGHPPWAEHDCGWCSTSGLVELAPWSAHSPSARTSPAAPSHRPSRTPRPAPSCGHRQGVRFSGRAAARSSSG